MWNSDTTCSAMYCWDIDTDKERWHDVSYHKDENAEPDQKDNTTA